MNALRDSTVVPGIRIEDVRVGERARKDYGDLTSLRESIAELGLLQPIVVLPDDYLLLGGRRLQACKELGWKSIPFIRSTTQQDAISRLRAERDENTCRKDMTPSELVAIGKKLEELRRPEAEERQRDAGRRFGRGINSSGANAHDLSGGHGIRREVADAVGMSEAAYTRAKRVVDTAEDETAPESVRDVAAAARAEMDAGSLSISGAESRVKQAQAKAVKADESVKTSKQPYSERVIQIATLADTGRTSQQIGQEIGVGEEYVRKVARENDITITADQVMNRRSRLRVDSNHIVNHAVTTLDGLVSGLDLIDFGALDASQAEMWASSLACSISALNRLNKQIKELTHA